MKTSEQGSEVDIDRNVKRALLIVGPLAIIVLVGMGWYFFGDIIEDYLQRRPFEAGVWQASKPGVDAVRIQMVDDLLRRHKLRGMTRQELAALLGEPDQTGYFKDYDLVYWLGPERGFISIDSEWLVFRLSAESKVIEYAVVTD